MPDGVQYSRGEFLRIIKKARGGKCVRCGYNKCSSALEFHHLDPSKKDFTISNSQFRLKDGVEESKKCVLLCSNCHKELHANLWNIEDVIGGEDINDANRGTKTGSSNNNSQI